jgi:hypothetical protein
MPLKSIDDVPFDPLTEALAAHIHDIWSGWLRYMLLECNIDFLEPVPEDGREAYLQRWDRQMKTSYPELTEDEKESDRKEARAILDICKAFDRPFDGEIHGT